MSDVSLAIMAHPQREAMVRDLLIPALDEEPTVVWDRLNDRWDTGKRALQAHGGSDFHIVIQDDAVVSPGLVAGVRAMLAVLPPGVPIGLYYGSVRPRRSYHRYMYEAAKAEGARWIVLPESPMWGVGLVIPTADVAGIIELGDTVTSTNNYDTRVATYYQRCHVEQWFPIPSPVDHRIAGDSLVPGRGNHERVAHESLGDTPVTDIDWSAPVVRQFGRPPQEDRRGGVQLASRNRPPTLIEQGRAEPRGITPRHPRQR